MEYSNNALLNGPGFSQRQHPLVGVIMCKPFPIQYVKIMSSRVETFIV